MCDTMIRKGSFLLAVFVILILISGCETINAMMMGDIKMQDVVKMISPATIHRGETENIENKNIVLQKIKDADTWIRQNLW